MGKRPAAWLEVGLLITDRSCDKEKADDHCTRTVLRRILHRLRRRPSRRAGEPGFADKSSHPSVAWPAGYCARPVACLTHRRRGVGELVRAYKIAGAADV